MKSDFQATGEETPELHAFLAELYAHSSGASFGLSLEQFKRIFQDIRRKYLAEGAGHAAVREFYAGLRIEDLVLARACAEGNERAWETFLTRFREKLYEVATYVAKESSAGKELADSIYADLYGTKLREGRRVSKLASYTGRGSLEGWLRTVIAQEHVNQYRRRRRLVSLDEETEEGAQFASVEAGSPAEVPVDPKLESATDEALCALLAEDRFLLASYYLEDRTLADIARLLRVHESTVSRKVDKLVKSLRKQILAGLSRRGMSRRQSEEALEVDIRDLRLNIRDRILQETPAPAFSDGKAEVPGRK